MERKENMPGVVYLGLYGIKTRKTALIYLVGTFIAALISVFYGFKKTEYFYGALLFVATIWYWYSIRWMDRNSKWDNN